MSQSRSATARVLAVFALACGFVLVFAVVVASLDGEDSTADRRQAARGATIGKKQEGRKTPTAYVVQNGDTLTSIARRTGVSVARIEQLNPGVDPQILISGEKLKLR